MYGYACVGGFKNLFLTPGHDWIHDCIRDWHPGLDPDLGSSLEYEYSVTQSPPGDYIYVKGWDGGPGFRELCRESQIVRRLSRLPGAD